MTKIDDFVKRLLSSDFRQIEIAVGIIWIVENQGDQSRPDVREIAALIEKNGGARVNASRLRQALTKSADVVSAGSDSFKTSPRLAKEISERYARLFGPTLPVDSGSLLELGLTANARGYIQTIAHQINASYDNALFDCCAVMCRRLCESLLIDVFDARGKISEISDANGKIVSLSQILSVVGSARPLRFGRLTSAAIERVKKVGDLSAHNRTFVARKRDIDQFSTDLHAVTLELIEMLQK